MIYFIKVDNRVKIGFTNTSVVEHRLKQLHSELRHHLTNPEIILVIKGDRQLEKKIHQRFTKSKITFEKPHWMSYHPVVQWMTNFGREWFNLTPELEFYIQEVRRELETGRFHG